MLQTLPSTAVPALRTQILTELIPKNTGCAAGNRQIDGGKCFVAVTLLVWHRIQVAGFGYV